MKKFIEFIFILFWLAGIALSTGFWQTLFAIIIPIYSLYLVVEKVLIVNNLM